YHTFKYKPRRPGKHNVVVTRSCFFETYLKQPSFYVKVYILFPSLAQLVHCHSHRGGACSARKGFCLHTAFVCAHFKRSIGQCFYEVYISAFGSVSVRI